LKRKIRGFALACILVGIALFVCSAVSSTIHHYQIEVRCSTPDFVGFIQGVILDVETRQPISNAEVVITNTSREKSLCSDIACLSEEHLLADENGIFIARSSLHPDQTLNIFISAEGCSNLYESQVHAAIFGANLLLTVELLEDIRKDGVPIFFMRCGN
jgi:hypothetical protein